MSDVDDVLAELDRTDDNAQAQDDFESFVDTSKRKRLPYKGIAKAAMKKAAEHVQQRMLHNFWSDTPPAEFVALYAQMHNRVYGVYPLELDSINCGLAAKAARKMLVDDFDNDPFAMVQFIMWTWAREDQREKQRRTRGEDSNFRIGWRLAFGASFLTDWRRYLLSKKPAA